MEMTLTTPGLLFPAISLLLLAYTNRFVTLTSVIRHLVDEEAREDLVRRQIQNLQLRLQIIRLMQVFGVCSFILCTSSMFALFLHMEQVGKYLFGLSLVILTTSLIFSLYEVHISTKAINFEIERIKC